MVLKVWGDEEGCIAIDLWSAVNFVHGQYNPTTLSSGGTAAQPAYPVIRSGSGYRFAEELKAQDIVERTII